MLKESLSKINQSRAYLAWGAVSLFFFYQYILRVYPNVMADQIRHEFSMNAEQFSNVGAFTLYAYAFLQIPLGIMLDRIGIKRTVMWSVFLCITGALLFAIAKNNYVVYLSRFIIGAGSASAFICALKIVRDYLPEGKRGLLIGATLSMGAIGALFTGKPFVIILENHGWREAIASVGVVGILIFLLCNYAVPAHRTNITTFIRPSLGDVLKGVWRVLLDRRIITFSILAVGLYTPLSVLADLWGTTFLVKKYSLNYADAAQTSMMMYAGMMVGSLTLPWFCEKYNLLRAGIKISCLGLLILFSYLLYGPSIGFYGINALLFSIGFLCGAEMICFTYAAKFMDDENSGLALGVVNTMNMLGGAIAQQIVGSFLDLNWQGKIDKFGIRDYSIDEFIDAMFVMIVIIAFCLLLSVLTLNSKFINKRKKLL